jgi:ABC-type transport system involved in multi-copper enzyme maturation permease subunit
MLKNLLWKEWRENLWKLGFCLCVSLAFTGLLFRIRLTPDTANGVVISLVQMFMVCVVYALDLFSGEMSHRTIHLLFKIPVPRWQIFYSKVLVALGSLFLIFISTGLMMEFMAGGRETEVGMLFQMNGLFGLCAGLLLIWFCVFGCQSRNEAGSLVALFGVLIGWGIVYFWSGICDVPWAYHFVPYAWTLWAVQDSPNWSRIDQLLISQVISLCLALALACYRYTRIRRYL